MIELAAVGLGMALYSGYCLLTRNDNTNDICRYRELNSLMGEGIKCSKHVRLSVKQSNTHVLMIAPSESGKSRKFIMPNVNSLENCSIICTDPSCEIEATCTTSKKKYILNPFRDDTMGYNPLSNCKNEFEVRKIASVILTNGIKSNKEQKSNQQDWIAMATPLLTSYMIMNYHTKKYSFSEMIKNICTKSIISQKDSNTISIYKEIVDSEIQSAIVEIESFLQVLGAVQTLSSIRTVMNSCLQLFLDSNLQKIFNRDNIKLSDIRKEESIVYIQIPEHHADYFSPLVATFLTQMFDNYLENDGLQTYVLLDEMANIGIIPSFSKLLSTARKHNISIVGAIQSLTQLSTLHGELQGKEITELFKTILVCGGLRDSAEYVSKMLGTKDYRIKDTWYTDPLMTADEVRRMDKDDVLIICNNKRPVIDKMMNIVV